MRARTVAFKFTLWAIGQKGSPGLCPRQDPWKGLDRKPKGDPGQIYCLQEG